MYQEDKVGSTSIAKQYGVGYSVIISILKENNIPIRDKTWILYNKPPFKGYKFSEEQKQGIRDRALNAYKKDPLLKDKIRQKTLEQISNGKMPKANTSIEKRIASILIELGFQFEHQKIFGFWCFDFYLPQYKTFIECDGDYWHAHPDKYLKNNLNKTQKNNLKRSKQKETYCLNKKYKLIRFWERDINDRPEFIKEELCKIKNTS